MGIVLLVLTIAAAGVAVPVAAGDGAHGEGADQRCEDPGKDAEADPGCSERAGSGEEPALELLVGVDQGPFAGFFEVTCFGSPQDHACDKEGGLSAGSARIDYSGNNSADLRDREGGGGDTITVSAGNRSASGSFDCEFTRATVTNATACEAGGSPPGGSTGSL